MQSASGRWVVALAFCLALGASTAFAQLQSCELCPCSRLISHAAAGRVDLLVTRSRSSPVSLTTVTIKELYRVRLQSRDPFQDFHVCSVSEAPGTDAVFPSRYLPLQARLLATCSNIVTSGPTFEKNPGSVGELQFLWQAPSQEGRCVVLSGCLQHASGPNANRWVHRSVRVCTPGMLTVAPDATTPGQGASTLTLVGTTPAGTTPTEAETFPATSAVTTTQPVEVMVPTTSEVTTPPPAPVVSTTSSPLPPRPNPFTVDQTIVPFPPATSLTPANVASVPSQGVLMTFPGPRQSSGVEVSLVHSTSNTATVMFTSDTLYQVRTTSTIPYKRCYILSTAQPRRRTSLDGEFVGRLRQGGEDRFAGFSNLVECSAGQGLTASSTTAFWKAPTDTPCVEFSVWLELTDGELTRVDTTFCRMTYPTNVGSCPADPNPSATCSQCNPNSGMHFTHTGRKPQCCNGLPVGREQQCCGGTIQPGTLAKGWLCCGNHTTFNPEEATCCRGNKQLGRASDVFCCEMKSFSPSTVLTKSREARCCGNEAFDPSDKLCCGGTLHRSWPGVVGTQMACCPWDGLPFNPSTHNCMLCRGSPLRIIQPKGTPLNCCGSKPYNRTDQVCCDFQSELLISAPYASSGCCGGQVFNRDNSMCCLGQVARAAAGQQVNSNWRCCDTQAFDPTTHECLECSGFRRLVPISESYSCCGITPFSRLSAICCNGQVLQLDRPYASLALVPQFACCGNRAFDPATQTCCSLSTSSVVNRRGTSCCGTNAVFNTVLGERCIQCLGGDPQVLTAVDERICCGSQLYDPVTAACCINPLRVVAPVASRQVSVSPRLFCCSGVAYDANLEKCCPNSNTVVAASALC